jgi:WD repeat-containing protein 26
MMCSNAEDLRRRAEWDGAKGTSRQKLLMEIQSIISFFFFKKKKTK